MRDLKIGVVGEILAGLEAGRFVEVIDDADNTGGCLIVTYSDAARSPEVFDAWVESIVDVETYFDECGWVVQWQQDS